jgi:hypothetical protein
VLTDNVRDLNAVADEEDRSYAVLAAVTAPAPIARVPLLGTDVHDVDGLVVVADALFDSDPTGDPGTMSTPRPAGDGRAVE